MRAGGATYIYEHIAHTHTTTLSYTYAHFRAGRIMIELDKEKREDIEERRKSESLEFDYDFKSGDAVQVKVQDQGETRTTIYKGVVIAKRNKGLGSNFSLLNQIDEGERLELLIPTYAPSVKGIKILQKAHIHKGKKRVRRSKLYYLRDRNPAEFTVV